MAPIPDEELGEKLKQAHEILILRLSLSSSAEHLAPLLEQMGMLLSKVNQSPAKSVQTALSPLAKALVMEELMELKDVDIRTGLALCLNEIIRISAPDYPYDGDKMKDAFELIVSIFKNLSDKSSRLDGMRVRILKTMVTVKYCVIMLDLECSWMIGDMFGYFLQSLRDNQEAIFALMETIMTCIFEESDEDVSIDLINPLLATLRKNNQAAGPVARRLAEQVIKKCAGKLGPYLVKVISSLATSFDHYSDVIASVCHMKNCSGENISRNSSNQLDMVTSPTPLESNKDESNDNMTPTMRTKRQQIEQTDKDMVSSPSSRSKSHKGGSNTKATLAVNTNRKRTRQTDIASEAMILGENLVGENVKVWWPMDQMFYEGVVDCFYPLEKKHKVVYADGDVEVLNLNKEMWEFGSDHRVTVTVSDEGPGIENSSLCSSSDMQRMKKGTGANTVEDVVIRRPESKPKDSCSEAGLTSIDETKADPKSERQITKPRIESEDENTKCENSPKKLEKDSCNDSAKPSDITEDVNNAKVASHLLQHNQSTTKSNNIKLMMIKTPGSVGIGYVKCDWETTFEPPYLHRC